MNIETAATGIDEAATDTFADRVLGDYAGANAFFLAGIGDRLGLFTELAVHGPATGEELASRTGLQERYLREWLGGMAAAGYLRHDRANGRYTLPTEHVPVLAEEAGPSFFGNAFFDFSTNFGETYHRLLDAFRTGGWVSQDLFGPEVAWSIDRFTAPWFEHRLIAEWLPQMPEVLDRLEAGATVCDVGCGRGRGIVKLAEAFPACRFVGIDLYEPAILAARARAEDEGLTDRVRFEVGDVSEGMPDRYDVITTFDVLHDSADPEGLLRAIRSGLGADGRYVCVDINCAERPEDNVGPMGTVMFGLSLAYCLPVSLAGGGAGLGTLGLPEGRLREMATGSGFSRVRRVPIDDPFNNLYELGP